MKLGYNVLLFAAVCTACTASVTPDDGSDASSDAIAVGDSPSMSIDVLSSSSDGGCSVDGSSCGAGCANCGAGCVSTQSDNMNCGGCGNTCGAGRSCQGGRCACAPGNMMCGGLCINTMTDSMNCGACGRACPMDQRCLGGTCQINCNMPTELCVVAGEPICVNTNSDPANCGGCGTVCTAVNATAACGGGRCSLGPCNRGYGNCDQQAGNGCELNTNADGANCGRCGNVCPSSPNASASCNAGVCGVGACNRGFGNCDGNLANGCEIDTDNSSANCGACGNRCASPANGAAACAFGVCAVGGCNPGFGNCDGNVGNGCETSTSNSLANCGACNNVCPAPANGSAVCTGGVCGVGMCSPGFGNCDFNAGNGCESDTTSSVTNCGACGNVCPTPPNVAAVCLGGVCGIGACNPGSGNCDGNLGNGCESNIFASPIHCGACGRVCPAAPNASASCAAVNWRREDIALAPIAEVAVAVARPRIACANTTHSA